MDFSGLLGMPMTATALTPLATNAVPATVPAAASASPSSGGLGAILGKLGMGMQQQQQPDSGYGMAAYQPIHSSALGYLMQLLGGM